MLRALSWFCVSTLRPSGRGPPPPEGRLGRGRDPNLQKAGRETRPRSRGLISRHFLELPRPPPLSAVGRLLRTTLQSRRRGVGTQGAPESQTPLLRRTFLMWGV